MEKVEILKAPRPVKGFRRKGSNTACLNEKLNDLPRSKLFVLQQSESFRQLSYRDAKFSNSHISHYDCEEEITKEFEELSIKDEIFNILKNDSTYCDSPFFINQERSSFLSKGNLLENIELDIDISLEFLANTKDK